MGGGRCIGCGGGGYVVVCGIVCSVVWADVCMC